MKKSILIATICIIVLFVFYACGTSGTKATPKENPQKTVYTCSMHPEVISTEPGNCPKCGMELIKKEVASGDSTKMEHADSTMH